MNLKMQGIEFSYSSSKVLDGVSLEIDEGFVCILGQNGVGKSTLIHCINRLLKPQKGDVFVNDVSVNAISLKEVAKTVGYVPQAASDIFALSVVDTVMMGRHPHSGWNTGDEDFRVAEECLEALGIQHLAMRLFSELSAGQKQKVMIARGLAQGTELILLDEPTANLDIKHQLEVMETLAGLVKTKKMLVVMVSHDLNITSRYADIVIMMKSGKIFATGRPEDILNRDNIREVYGVESEIVLSDGKPFIIPRSPVKTTDA